MSPDEIPPVAAETTLDIEPRILRFQNPRQSALRKRPDSKSLTARRRDQLSIRTERDAVTACLTGQAIHDTTGHGVSDDDAVIRTDRGDKP